ncbi:hypothetical protein M8818_004145 [Zalaria obscura]|uniref:Uncharacterized protein n=1 Tax=Zalaria obscura TaxID=2024903 RepID=A0ACC3SCE6_9PEZI
MVEALGVTTLQDQEDPLCKNHLLNTIGAAFWITGSVAGAASEVAGPVGGVVSGALARHLHRGTKQDHQPRTLVRVLGPSTPGQLWCNNAADGQSLADTLSSIGAAIGNNVTTTNVGQLFSNGRFLFPNNISVDSDAQSVVFDAMRNIVGVCDLGSLLYMLTIPSNNRLPALLQSTKVLLFINSHMDDLITVSDDCQSAGPSEASEPSNINIGVADLPQCFYKIHVGRAKGTPCFAQSQSSWPGWLQSVISGTGCYRQRQYYAGNGQGISQSHSE